ncbi:MAG: undecaprenyl/decaprenyl-phosphate alpha-N-acetylglucosaminyl 1-phosphate transferase [Actinomycetota bacterium]|nr:undecaprenyl/decaprenyl-phosphate alpha-N-acetylglucosaminyl 1-phosphate transferase [Actinomycetota bacterium]
MKLALDTLGDNLQVAYGAILALVIVVLLTPAVGGMARMLGVVGREEPGRRPNARAVPRLGGIALFLGIFVPALAFLDIGREMRGLLLGAAVATTVGAVDDFRGLRWWEKLGGQVAAALIPTYFGIWVHRFTFPVLGIHELSPWIGVTVTVIWIVAIMNMVNFLDGLDGLAAGVCAISAGTFSVIALSLGKPQAAIATAIVLGACLGFLRHNFYPARIFMGDSGALLLGFVLATISVQFLLKTAAIASLFFPLLVLAIPILDTSFVIAKRIKYRQPVFVGDLTHLHHRLLNIGFSERRAVAYIYFWCGTLALAALSTRFIHPHAHGFWHPWRTVAVGAIGLLALAASVYMVYLLEIVKLANLRIRRREVAAPASDRVA